MRRFELLIAHHFPLSNITGVTVTVADLLHRLAQTPDIHARYLSYDGIESPERLDELLGERYGDATCVFGINLQIEVAWELSRALMDWCKLRHIVPLIYVCDYWPQHRAATQELVDAYGAVLLASTPFIQQLLATAGFEAILMNTGVPFLDLAPLLPDRRGETKTIASIGRLVPRKRLGDVVRAFALAKLDGVARLYLKMLPTQTFASSDDAAQLKLVEDEIELAGFSTGTVRIERNVSARQEYRDFSALVSCSSYEGFGLPAIQAAYAGCVPLLSNVPPHVRTAGILFEERSEDFLFPVGDIRALAELLQDEVRTGRRSIFLRERIESIRQTVDRCWSMDSMAAQLVTLCRDLSR
jgi:glycosyltransferase involved in cell wall biosynthesis